MPAPTAVYAAVLSCLQALGVARHRTAQAALAQVVSALLLGQSLRPSVLARALSSPQVVPARARYQQVARVWNRPWLTAAQLTTALVAGALALARPTAPRLVLDSLRCGAWEVFTIGLTFHGRVLPLSRAPLPYPWPKGEFTPMVCALVRQVAAVWPADAPRPHLLADRAFPSGALVATLDAVGWDYTLRLRASDVVTTATGMRQGYDVLTAAVPEGWSQQRGRFGRHADAGLRSQVVVGRGLVVPPWHQRDAGSARARARRRAQRLHGVKQTRRASPTEPWLILLTTAPTWLAAVRAYRQRYHTEGSVTGASSVDYWTVQPCAPTASAITRKAATAMRNPAGMGAMAGIWASASPPRRPPGPWTASSASGRWGRSCSRGWATN